MNTWEYSADVTSPHPMIHCPCCNRPQSINEYCIQIKEGDYDDCMKATDNVEENRILAYEGEDMPRSDAQACVEAEDIKNGPYACVRCRDKVETLEEGLCPKCVLEISSPMSHTKGPWVYSKQERSYEQDYNGTYHPFLIRDEDSRMNFVALFDGANGTEANARLVAAAPDLLEACKAVVAAWESGDLAAAANLCREAAVKAEGSQFAA